MRKTIIVVAITLLFIAGAFVVIYNTHPIVIKWIAGTAKSLGKPIPASVYTDGKLNNAISVYKNGDFGYLLSLKEFDKYQMLRYIQVDPGANSVGRPVGSDIASYDVIGGRLLQDEVGEKSVNFKDDMKGFNFDPKLTVTGKDVAFALPPGMLKYNAIRISIN